jgi:hypothetical protein
MPQSGILERQDAPPVPPVLPICTHIKEWQRQIKAQEQAISQARRNTLNPEHQIVRQQVLLSECTSECVDMHVHRSLDCAETESMMYAEPVSEKPAFDIIADVVVKFGLNEKQDVAYRIIADFFIAMKGQQICWLAELCWVNAA